MLWFNTRTLVAGRLPRVSARTRDAVDGLCSRQRMDGTSITPACTSACTDEGPGIGVKQTLKEFGAGVRVAVGGLGRGAIKAMTAPLVGLHRFKPTPKLDAPAIRGGESAPVEVCLLTLMHEAGRCFLPAITTVPCIATDFSKPRYRGCMLVRSWGGGGGGWGGVVCLQILVASDCAALLQLLAGPHILSHYRSMCVRSQKDTKLRPQQTVANLVFLSARPEMYKVGLLLDCLPRNSARSAGQTNLMPSSQLSIRCEDCCRYTRAPTRHMCRGTRRAQ